MEAYAAARLFAPLQPESMFEVTVEDTFSSGHFLRNYKGKCEKPHGHNYKVRVTLRGMDATVSPLRELMSSGRF
jgi:hypothetical protein